MWLEAKGEGEPLIVVRPRHVRASAAVVIAT